MKKKILISTALTALVSALVGCGGESGNINEDTNNGVTTSTSCKTTDANCQSFYMVYPIAGLNFDCSSDKVNHFVTAQSGNAFTGACKLGDTVNFSIKGQTADKQINLGSLDLKPFRLSILVSNRFHCLIWQPQWWVRHLRHLIYRMIPLRWPLHWYVFFRL